MLIPLRDENPTRTFPFLTLLLIAGNAAVFLYEVSQGRQLGSLIKGFGLVPYEITHGSGMPRFGALFSSMFLHGSWPHLIFNMLYLWIFGNNIEDALGHIRFPVFYLACGAAAGLAHVAINPDSHIPTVGASGAVSGILGGYILMFPRAKVLTLLLLFVFVRFVALPAVVVLGIWIAGQLFWALSGAQGSIAWFAHIGGFFAGFLLVPLFRRRR